MNHYQYDDLGTDSERIRLVTIEPAINPFASIICSLSTYSLENAPPYDALSYCWEDQKDPQSLTIDGMRLDVTLNLSRALRSMRATSEPATFWVDAICINQTNVLERNQQVALMLKIYGKANRVIAWLGEETTESKSATRLIRLWSKASQLLPMEVADDIRFFISSFPEAVDVKSWFALRELLERPWWNRMWTYQEFVAAENDPLFVCGSDWWSSAQLITAGAIWNMMAHHMEVPDLPVPLWVILPGWDSKHFRMMAAHRNVRSSPSARQFWKDGFGHEWDAVSLQDYTHTRDSTDPRDKLYALLGISDSSEIDLQPDYNKPVADVYREFTIKCLLSTSHRHIINFCTLTSNSSQPTLKMPSWVPDFRASTYRAVCLAKQNFKAGGEAQQSLKLTPQTQTLSIQGFQVDEIIQKVEPQLESRMALIEHLGDWRDFVRDHGKPHPLGIPQLQAYFRALILDTCHSSNDSHLPHSQKDKEILFQHAVDFLYTCGYHSSQVLGHSDASLYHQWNSLRRHNSIYAKLFSLWSDGFTTKSQNATDEELLRTFLPSCQKQEWISGLQDAARKRNFAGDDEGPFTSSFRYSMYRTTEQRILFTSQGGYIGLGPDGLEQGDLMYVFPGWNTPFIVRPEANGEGRYTIIGECYVYGLMQGEVVDLATRRGTKRQTIEIC